MNTFAKKWFYQHPGKITHEISETVRQSLWSSGLYNIWIDAIDTTPPYKVQGYHGKIPLEIEWQPAKWLILRSAKDNPKIQHHMTWLLDQQCNITFIDQDNRKIYEWYLEDFDKRWREISGNPMYSSLERTS